jgi:hypothetical protein
LQEHGPKRLKAALSCADDPTFIRDLLLPFLALLGCDALGRGTCKQPLISLLETIYQVRFILQLTPIKTVCTASVIIQQCNRAAYAWLVQIPMLCKLSEFC